MAEDGRIAIYYQLTETDETDSAVRTKKNIEESDGTLIIVAFKIVKNIGIAMISFITPPWII